MKTPESLADWIAWFGLVVALFSLAATIGALAWAAMRHVKNEAERQSRDAGLRVEQLERIIYNTPPQYGLGAQLIAIGELERFPDRSEAILRLALVLEREYQHQNAPAQLDAVKSLIVKLRRQK